MIGNISAVIFDRDNTLTRFDTDAIAARNMRYSAIAPELPAGAVMAHWASWAEPWPQSAGEELTFWARFWDTLAERYQLSGATARALELAGSTYYTDFVAFPDAIDCLQLLRAHGLRLAVLTNFELPSVDLSLLHAGIDPSWFSVLLASGTLGTSKPDPCAYLAAAAALNLPASACVFVDDLLANVEGACAAGMDGVWLDRQERDIRTPLKRISNLRSLGDLVAPIL
jgi:putative hydrolase of the HAD superfamily